ncbi:MAG: hypothetical protein HOP11_13035 [Saprospiraceae bacterium]|nr:hypothetical protein [Saprospiraceae bacterium]
MIDKSRIVIFNPFDSPHANPRSIRIQNLIKEIQSEYDVLFITNPVKGLTSRSSFIKYHGFTIQTQKGNSIKNNIFTSILKKIIWPDVLLLNSIFHGMVYIFKYYKSNDIVITVSNPVSVHCIGILLKIFRKRIFWIADIGDQFQSANQSIFGFFSNLFESYVIRKASKIVTNSNGILSHLKILYPRCENKFLVIHNGSSIDFSDIEFDNSEPYIISYMGNSYEPIRSGIEELKVLSEVQLLLLKNKLHLDIQLIGRQNSSLVDKFQSSNIHFIPHCNSDELLQHYSKSRILFSLANKNYAGMPSKLEEYCSTGIPIIYFCYSEEDPGVSFLHQYKNHLIFIIGTSSTSMLFEFIDLHLKEDLRTKPPKTMKNQSYWLKLLEDLNI